MRNTYLWLVQLITGAVILVLLGIHLTTQLPDGFALITQRFSATLSATILGMRQNIAAGVYITLLAVVLYHGFSGLRIIILETASSARTARVTTYVIIAVGVILFGVVLAVRWLS